MKQAVIKTTLLFILIFSFLGTNAQRDHEGWKAGVARKVITPEQAMWMAGYASREEPAQGKLHDLWAKALVLEDADGKRAVMISTDLLGMTEEITGRIKTRLKEKFSLSTEQLMINSSHTHSGPVLHNALKDIYPLDANEKEKIEKYTHWLEDQIVKLVGEAIRDVEPVEIFSKNGVARFQVNRRNNKSPTLHQQSDLNGPNDYAVPVIKVVNKSEKLKAIAFGYACHPTVLNGYQWSGDYPGFAQIELEGYYPGAIAMFFQGTGADQNPLPRRTIPLAQQYGRILAAAVDRVLQEEMQQLSPKLITAYAELELPLADMPTKVELVQLTASESGWEQRWANRILGQMKSDRPFQTSYPLPMQWWQLGEQTIIGMGGEVVIEYAIKFKQLFGSDIFVLGYTNDVMAYIPSKRILAEGGYEGKIAQRVYGLPANWSPNIENLIFDGIEKLALEVGIEPHGMMAKISNQSLVARPYFSGFIDAHDTYNAISSASDGNIYYVLSSAAHDKGGQMYAYYPEADSTAFLADLTDICGEEEAKAIAQGKSHVNFYEMDGKLYFATHVGYYEMIDGMERLPVNPPKDFKLYLGGHLVSYDLKSKQFEDLDIAPDGEGVITMTLDKQRGQIYGITWPKGYFIHYDIAKDTLRNLGLVSANGEAGTPGDDYRVLCRSMFVDNRDGVVYYSTAEGDIYSYDPDSHTIEKVEGVDLKLDYFGKYDFTRPGSMGYNWRRITWHPKEEVAYGVHGNSGYLFKFDPKKRVVEVVDRITSELSKRSGIFDQFSYGYLGFELGPDQNTLYYLTGGPVYIDGKRVKGKDHIAMGAARGIENLHLVTYHIPTGQYIDHGPVFYEDGSQPTYVNSIAIDKQGNVYTLARFGHNGKIIEDLVKIQNPFRKK